MTSYSSRDQFLSSLSTPAGIVTLVDGGLPIDLLIAPKDSATAIVFFHGAIEQHFTLPVLSGLGISGAVEATRIFVSDPSLILDENLLLAWYAGNRNQPNFQSTLTEILRHALFLCGAERVVLFGGSGGGFAALYYASQLENSLALPFNPQTNIAHYADTAVNQFATKAFGTEAPSKNRLANLPKSVTTDVLPIYAEEITTTVAYIQNLNDQVHIDRHLKPFIKSIHPGNEFYLLAQEWRDGHTPPPKPLLTKILDAVATDAPWSETLPSLGFKKM